MQTAVKLTVTIPESHRVELELPKDMPVGPAEVIVLAATPKQPPAARPLGTDAGLITIRDDFDAPLPECVQQCACEADERISLESVRRALSKIPGSLTADFVQERTER